MFDFSRSVSSPTDPLLLALSSCENLVQYLDAEAEVQNLASKATQSSSSNSLIDNRWSVAWLKIESKPLQCFLTIFNYTKSYLVGYFPNLTKKIQISINHRLHQHKNLYFQSLFKEQLLVRSLNVHQPSSSDFYLHSNITLRTRLFENNQFKSSGISEKKFFMSDGLCKGECVWFTYLYFKTLSYFSDPEFQLQTIARLFENGAPRQAELIQLFGWTDVEIIEFILGTGLKINEQISSIDTDLLKVNDLSNKLAKSTNFLKDLPLGAFSIVLSINSSQGHEIRYFKISENLGFIFDPNIGLIKLKETNQHLDLAEKLIISARIINSLDEYSYYEIHQITSRDQRASDSLEYTISVE